MDSTQFFTQLWQDFVTLAPQAAAIREKLISQGEPVLNDHVAFRTYNIAPINIERLEPLLFSMGYQRLDSYQFNNKHLNAWSYIDPQTSDSLQKPLIFFSELQVEALSTTAQSIIKRLVNELPCDDALIQQNSDAPPIFCQGRLWSAISYKEYQLLSSESEYAAWVAVHGFHANHFTINVNHLTHYHTIHDILNWVERENFSINTAGGRVKGNPQLLLEQGATMADQVAVTFSCGYSTTIPGCFYEFALRYPDPSGKLYMGFVEGNADKIFESTHQA